MIRIVLHEATTRDAIDDVTAALGLLLVNIVPKTDTHPAQVIYVTPDTRTAVHLVDEGGTHSFVVRAERDDEAAIWSEKLKRACEDAS